MIPHLIHTYQFNLQHIEGLVKDLTDEQMVQQPAGLVNHPMWTLGHLASAANAVAVKGLGLESTFPQEWEQAFKTGGVPSDAASAYPTSKDEILAQLKSQHERVTDELKQTDAEIFSKEFPDENMRKYFPTIGDFLVYLMSAHEGTHIGQLQTWKRAMGLVGGGGDS
jgi:hypothetical protein